MKFFMKKLLWYLMFKTHKQHYYRKFVIIQINIHRRTFAVLLKIMKKCESLTQPSFYPFMIYCISSACEYIVKVFI